jgi:hypothetical protein
MGSRTRGLLSFSIAPQSSVLKLQLIITESNINWYYTVNSNGNGNGNEMHIVKDCCTCTAPSLSILTYSWKFKKNNFVKKETTLKNYRRSKTD